MAYLYIFLSAGCSVIIAHLLKRGESEKLRTLNTLTVNYLVAAAAALLLDPPGEGMAGLLYRPLPLLFFIATGSFFIGNFMLYSKSVHFNGVGVSVAAMRVSLLFPVLVSVLFYRESLTALKVLGVVLVFAALLLLVPRRSRKFFAGIQAGWLLPAVFLLSGMADSALKVYQEEFDPRFSELQFMSLVFGTAFLAGAVLTAARKGPAFTRRELLTGGLIGLPNLFSAVFLIYALREVDGAVAFPLVNSLIVLGGTLLGLFAWGDRLSARQWSGIVIGLIAILILL